MFKKLLFLSASLLVVLASWPAPARAASEFETSYQIDYTIQASGQVSVDQRIDLANKLANIYATEYSVTIGSTELSAIKAWDQFGKLEPKVEVGENRTTITLTFPEKVVGKAASRQFHVTYNTTDFAQTKGRVLEIGIPLLADIENLSDYQVRLHIPQAFDKANYFLPTPHDLYQDDQQRHYVFTKNNLNGFEGITGTFGEFQLFSFSLRYHLENGHNRQGLTQISLPPDTAYQQVAYTSITPPPLKIEPDADGNWLATYELGKNQAMEVTAEGVAKIFLTPQPDLSQLLDDNLKADYLKEQTYWPVADPEIKALAKKLTTPEAIYNFLVRNFKYDYSRLTTTTDRKGANWALSHQNQVICMEFTDLFITLARAAGIPAREVNGFAYTTNSKLRPLSLEQDVLHAWPEYYDEEKQVWVPVDPTWGNTTGGLDFFHKLDLDHFVFVRRGLNSEQPLPAGSYKLADTTGKDVQINFADSFPEASPLKLNLIMPEKPLAGLPLKVKAEISNPGPVALYNQIGHLELKKQGQTVLSEPLKLAVLPPGSSRTFTFDLDTSLLNYHQDYEAKLVFATQQTQQTATLQPLISLSMIASAITVIGFLILVLIWKIK